MMTEPNTDRRLLTEDLLLPLFAPLEDPAIRDAVDAWARAFAAAAEADDFRWLVEFAGATLYDEMAPTDLDASIGAERTLDTVEMVAAQIARGLDRIPGEDAGRRWARRLLALQRYGEPESASEAALALRFHGEETPSLGLRVDGLESVDFKDLERRIGLFAVSVDALHGPLDDQEVARLVGLVTIQGLPRPRICDREACHLHVEFE
ncbi:MAG: hypothetical protein ACQEXJ_24700 [Myxococcota bacterium]